VAPTKATLVGSGPGWPRSRHSRPTRFGRILGDLVTAPDVRAAWERLSPARERAVIDVLMTVRLLPGGAGRKWFDPAYVQITPKAM